MADVLPIDRWAQARLVSVPEVAAALGLTVGRGRPPSWGPCPACGAERRGKEDPRLPLGVRRDGAGWRCHACQESGDALDLAARVVVGVRAAEARGEKAAALLGWYAAHGWCDPDGTKESVWKAPPKAPAEPPKRLGAAAVWGVWESCVAPGGAALEWLRSRGVEGVAATGVVRELPPGFGGVGWWPAGWVDCWRLVAPLWTADGEAAGLHGRAVRAVTPKTRNALGYEVAGLYLASPAALAMLRGQGKPRRVLVVEGFSDWLRAQAVAGTAEAVLGCVAGSWSTLGEIAWPAGCRVELVPDGDAAGARYAEAGLAALAAVGVSAVRLEVPEGSDLSDVVSTSVDLATLRRRYRGPDPEVSVALMRSKGGTVQGTLRNALTVLEADPRWCGRLRLNEFARQVEFDGVLVQDEDEVGIYRWLAENYGLEVSTQRVSEAIRYLARPNSYHPVREYLDRLRWDGVPRVDGLLTRYFGAPDTPLNREQAKRWMVSCVARVRQPGCKVDTVLILAGQQGLGKSRGLRALATRGEWFSDSAIDFRNKDAYQVLPGTWIYELAELDSFRRSEASAIKAFLASQHDTYRPSYGRNPVRMLRQTVFVGTTNEAEFLNDPTGSRRFWPVQVTEVDVEAIEADRNQLWAEAAALYAAGEPWWLSPEMDLELRQESEQYRQVDAWEAPITRWVSGRVSDFTVTELLEDALKIDPGRQTRADGMRAATVLKTVGCRKGARRTSTTGERVYPWSPPVRSLPGA